MEIKLQANAKINLTLGITGILENGYHSLDMIMQSINLSDKITIKKADTVTVSCNDISLCGDNNICYTAARKFFEYTDISSGADIHIEKNIPSAAGLGGGSADAAGVLTGLNRLYNTELSHDTLCKIGLSLGADVPFCIIGGIARVRGIGEEIEITEPIENIYLVIAKPWIKTSTKDMFNKIDSEIYNKKEIELPDNDSFVKALNEKDLKGLIPLIKNSFNFFWDIDSIKNILSITDYLSVSTTGSGPSVFIIYNNEISAKAAFDTLKANNIEAYITTPAKNGIISE